MCELRNDSSDRFILITDLHLSQDCATGWEVLARFVADVARMSPPPAFVLNTGDIGFADMGLTTSPTALRSTLLRYRDSVSRLPAPVYHAVGNHDLADPGCTSTPGRLGKELFESVFGPRYRSFDWRGYHFVVLDVWLCRTEARSGCRVGMGMDDEQLRWLQDDLSKCAPGQIVVLVDHHKVIDAPGEPGSAHRALSVLLGETLRAALRPDLEYIELSGCDHQNSVWRTDGWTSVTTASFCGAWWQRDLCIDGNRWGYALFVDRGKRLEHYHREHDAPLAIAERYALRTVHGPAVVTALDPRTGESSQSVADSATAAGGYGMVRVAVGDKVQEFPLFFEPRIPDAGSRQLSGRLSFILVRPLKESVGILCNGIEVAELPVSARPGEAVGIPLNGALRPGWNVLEFRGNAFLQDPILEVEGKRLADPRVARLAAAREGTPCEKHPPVWDTSAREPTSPWQYPLSRMWFCTSVAPPA